MVLTHSVDANGADKAGVRWYELRKYPAQPWAVYQGGTFSPDAHHRWMGSAAVDQNGNIGLVYSISSSTMYPSVGYTGRLVGGSSRHHADRGDCGGWWWVPERGEPLG